MKISPISNCSNRTFNGLWQQRKTVVGGDAYTTEWRYENLYFPFSDEAGYFIDRAIDSRTYDVSCPAMNDFETDHIVSDVKVMEKLPFSEEEFRAYKRFYGKVMTDSVKKVEQTLKEFNLYDYINGGKMYEFKKFINRLFVRG